MSADSIVGDGLAQSPCDELRDECARLRHDIEHHVAIAADLATEVEQMRAERDAARADALALSIERNNWQSMYHDAEAERDEALALLAEARVWVHEWTAPCELVERIDAALKDAP